jgi:hypothetical protein
MPTRDRALAVFFLQARPAPFDKSQVFGFWGEYGSQG